MTISPVDHIRMDPPNVVINDGLLIKSFHETDTQYMTIDGVGDLRALALSKDGSAWWVGGTQGKIAKSIDNGHTWSVYCPGSESLLDFRALLVLDSGAICAMSAGSSKDGLARIYRSSDGGDQWILTFCPQEHGVFFNAMQFLDEKNGFILCDPIDGYFVLFKTTDGGQNWSRLIPEKMPCALSQEIAFAASNSCLAVYGSDRLWFCTGGGSHARVFYSDDRGRHWDVSDTSMALTTASSGLFSIAFKDEKYGIAVGGDHTCSPMISSANVFLTSDGGKTWFIPDCKNNISSHYLSSVAWGEESTAYVVDRSMIEYNSLVICAKKGVAVGPKQKLAIFSTNLSTSLKDER